MMCVYNVGEPHVIEKEKKRTNNVLDFLRQQGYIINITTETTMKIKKGEYRIATSEGWKEEEGSYIKFFPFLIHRKKYEKTWILSHMATGYAIKKDLSLEKAKSLLEALKGYPLFLVPTVETFLMQKKIMEQKYPKHFSEMMKAINTNGENHE